MSQVRVRSYHRRSPHHETHREPREPRFSPVTLGYAAAEAQEILQDQDFVAGYESEAQAKQVQRALAVRGVDTVVFMDIGPPVSNPATKHEAEFMVEHHMVPGTRYPVWGVRKVSPEHPMVRVR